MRVGAWERRRRGSGWLGSEEEGWRGGSGGGGEQADRDKDFNKLAFYA